LENTEQLRNWINQKVEAEYGGNLTNFSEHTTVSRQTWMNILNNRYRSLRQQAIDDLCHMFDLSEIELYQTAHPNTVAEGVVHETTAVYPSKDEAERLATFLRRAAKKDREFIFSAAERCGFRRSRK